MPVIDRDGVQIAYDVVGSSASGPTVLLSHGFTASAHMWQATAKRLGLAAHARIITYDIRGHGRSDSPDDANAYSAELAVDDMAALLDAVGVDAAVIGGHSLGGYLSLRFHLVHRERVAGLVLIDTGPGYRQDEARAQWNRLAENYARSFERDGLQALGQGSEVQANVHRGADGLMRAARGILAQSDALVIESLPTISAPTLVIVGENDAPFVNGSNYMAAKIPGAQLAVIPDAAHAPNLENPAEFDRALSGFLTKNWPSP